MSKWLFSMQMWIVFHTVELQKSHASDVHDKFCSFHWMSLNLSNLLNIHHSMPALMIIVASEDLYFRLNIVHDSYGLLLWCFFVIFCQTWFEFSLFFLFFVNGLFYSLFIFLFYQLMIWMAIMKNILVFFFLF